MQQKISINENIILFDDETIDKDIDDILKVRLEFDELEKTIDDLFDPYLLADMKKAVDRIKKAKELDETVMIF
jgi:single-stranded DNA-specific DHH superfamily exonuclease